MGFTPRRRRTAAATGDGQEARAGRARRLLHVRRGSLDLLRGHRHRGRGHLPAGSVRLGRCRRAGSSPFDGTVFLACSGAKSANIRTSNPPGSDLPGVYVQQGEELDAAGAVRRPLAESEKFTPELVVLSIGGNDAGFSTIGVMCLVPGNCADKALVVDRRPRARCASRWTRRSPRCARRSRSTPVVVTAYPDPIFRGQGRPRLRRPLNDQLRNCSQVALLA